MIIRLNGLEKEVPDKASTIGLLLASLGVTPERVAVEINGTIVDPARFDTTMLHNGDRVEIVSFVGGG